MPNKKRGRPALPSEEVRTERVTARLDASTRDVLAHLVALRSGPRNPQGGGRGVSDVVRDAILAYASRDRKFHGVELRMLDLIQRDEATGEAMLRLAAACYEDKEVLDLTHRFLSVYDRAKRRVPRSKD